MQPPDAPTGAPAPSGAAAPASTPEATPEAPPVGAPALSVGQRPPTVPGTRRQTVVVAAVIAALVFGSQLLNQAIPASADQPAPGSPVEIAGGASITPAPGWVVSRFDSGDGVRLEKGVVALDLFEETRATATLLATAYVDEALRPQSTELTSSDITAAAIPAGPAARFTYQGLFTGAEGAIEGEVTAIVAVGGGVVADAWSSQGDLRELLDEVHAILGTIEVGG